MKHSHPEQWARELDRKFVLVPYDPREAVSVKKATKLAGRSASTLRNWCERFEIARRIAGGNWQISRVAFRRLYDWLNDRDIIIVRADRSEPLVALPLKLAAEIAARAAER